MAFITRRCELEPSNPCCGKAATGKTQLDDGWPESVEEQSLLLLVWRHYITRQYSKDVL